MSDQQALSHHRDALHAQLWLEQLSLAAMTHPELVRQALASVFDLRKVEQMTRETMDRLRKAQEAATACWREVRQLKAAISQLRDQLIALEYEKELAQEP